MQKKTPPQNTASNSFLPTDVSGALQCILPSTSNSLIFLPTKAAYRHTSSLELHAFAFLVSKAHTQDSFFIFIFLSPEIPYLYEWPTVNSSHSASLYINIRQHNHGTSDSWRLVKVQTACQVADWWQNASLCGTKRGLPMIVWIKQLGKC